MIVFYYIKISHSGSTPQTDYGAPKRGPVMQSYSPISAWNAGRLRWIISGETQ